MDNQNNKRITVLVNINEELAENIASDNTIIAVVIQCEVTDDIVKILEKAGKGVYMNLSDAEIESVAIELAGGEKLKEEEE